MPRKWWSPHKLKTAAHLFADEAARALRVRFYLIAWLISVPLAQSHRQCIHQGNRKLTSSCRRCFISTRICDGAGSAGVAGGIGIDYPLLTGQQSSAILAQYARVSAVVRRWWCASSVVASRLACNLIAQGCATRSKIVEKPQPYSWAGCQNERSTSQASR